MALIDIYRRYMYGQAPQDMGFAGGQRRTEGTRGLLGTGGQMGGGLLNTFEQPDTQGLYDIASNPFVGIGASLFSAGQRGQTPGMAAGDSIMQGLKFSETAARLGQAQKKRKLIAEYADKVPAEDKEIFEINPEIYIQTKLKTKLEKPTLSTEVLNVYNKLKNKTGEDFDRAYDNLSNAEKSLYNNKIKGNQDFIEQLASDAIKRQNTPIELKPGFKESGLVKGQRYVNSKGQVARWNGKEFIYE